MGYSEVKIIHINFLRMNHKVQYIDVQLYYLYPDSYCLVTGKHLPFLTQQPQLSLYNPETTSLTYAMGFNLESTNKYFILLEELYKFNSSSNLV